MAAGMMFSAVEGMFLAGYALSAAPGAMFLGSEKKFSAPGTMFWGPGTMSAGADVLSAVVKGLFFGQASGFAAGGRLI